MKKYLPFISTSIAALALAGTITFLQALPAIKKPTFKPAKAPDKVVSRNRVQGHHKRPGNALAANPTVSYSSPQVYVANTAIAPLSPVSSGVAAAGYTNPPLGYGGGFKDPTGLATDAAGNLYVADQFYSAIFKIPAGNGNIITLGTGFAGPTGVAVDGSGNIYVADNNHNVITKMNSSGGSLANIGSGFSHPAGVAVDAAGNVYVADAGNNAIKEIPAAGGSPVTLGSGFNYPTGVALDLAGNIYVADKDNRAIKKMPAGGGTPVTLLSGLYGPFSVTVDGLGNVYFVDTGNSNAAEEIPVGGGPVVTVAAGFSNPLGIALDGTGVLYVADIGGKTVTKVTPSGGYYVNTLPPGLSIDANTGVISGTPTMVSSAANYTVTAYNNAGPVSATVSIAVSPLSVSYASPQSYLAGNAISTLSPVSVAVAPGGYGGVTASFNPTGASQPFGLATDASGNIYVADEGTSSIKEILASGGGALSLGSGLSLPTGVAVDAAGNVYVADYNHNAVKEIPAGNGTPVTLGSGFTNPEGVAVDAAGNIYVADYGNNAVKKIPAGNGTPVTLGSGFVHPTGVALDAYGNIYVADHGNSLLKEMPPGGGAPVALSVGFAVPYAVTVDPSGNIFAADYDNSVVKELPAGGGSPVVIASGFNGPTGIAADGKGNIFIADKNNHIIKQVAPAGGYYIGTALPKGLQFNNANGAISGTPAVSPAANYRVTAYNSLGNNNALFNMQVKALSLSYTGPQTYYAGVAITPVLPTSSGVAAPAYGTGVTPIKTGFVQPFGIATDFAGNIYVADRGNNTINEIPVGGGAMVTIGSGFSLPSGITADASGNVYVADEGNNAVKKIPAAGGAPVIIGSGFASPIGVAVDSTGNVYVADQGNSAIKMIPAAGGSPVTLGSGFNHPYGLTVDVAGNVYVADQGNNAVKKIPSGGGTPITLTTGLSTPIGMAVDPMGNVFVADAGNNAVKMIPAAGGIPVIIGSGFSTPCGLSIDGAGNIYVADELNGAAKKIQPTGGYYISPVLAAGMVFNNTTGVISGTPAALSASKNYTISAYNIYGSGTAALNITVKPLPISYTSPQTYTAGTTITPLSPVSSGVAAPGYSTAPTVLGAGFHNPGGVAIDAAGNIYVADQGNSAVKKIPAGSNAPVVLGSGFNGPLGVAVDAAGNVYVADAGNNAVKKIPVGGGAIVTLGSGFMDPYDVTVDAAGNVYVADYGNNAVKEIPAAGGASVTLGSGFSGPTGVAVDALGDVFVADYFNVAVKEIPAGGTTVVGVGRNYGNPYGVAVDATGNLFISDYGDNMLREIPVGTTTEVPLVSGLTYATGLATDGAGNVYAALAITNEVVKVHPVGGYFISAPLPAGLAFSATTGVISGTPTVAAPATNYTVTAYNSYGGSAATVNITVNLPPLPTLSYNGPQSYPVNSAITPLSPGSTGVAAATYRAGYAGFGAGFTSPAQIAVDAAGNVYVADFGNEAVKKVPASNGAAVTLASGLAQPTGVAVDALGNVYIAEYSGGDIKVMAGGTGTPQVIATGFSNPQAVAVDAQQNVYVADYGNNAIKKFPAAGGTAVSIGAGFNGPSGVAVDGLGNVYVADCFNGAVKEILASNGSTIALGSGFKNPYGITVDATGNVFVSDDGNDTEFEIPAAGGAPVAITKFSAQEGGVAVDAYGNLFVADTHGNKLRKIVPAGGYYLGASLPPGLSFSNATGVISGKPTAISPQTNYIVTAYNLGGGTSAYVNIGVAANANLSGLKLSSGTLSPAFAAGITNYSANVANGVTSITVTPTASDAGSTIKVNGVAVASGSASGAINLSVGLNTINTVVTAQDGTTTQTYTVTITRAGNANANLSSLKMSKGIFSPTFAGGTTSYTDAVANNITSVTVTPTTADPSASVKVNGTAVPSGTASAAINLAVGPNTIGVVVTASDGATNKIYTVTVNRAPSNNDNLTSLKLSKGIFSPAFASATGSYTDAVGNAITSVTVTPTTADPTATVKVNGTPVTSGTASGAINLNVGANSIAVAVTAQDGTTTKTYTVTVTRAGNSNDNLTSLKMSKGIFSPTFASTTTSYADAAGNTISSVTVTPTASDPGATIKVNGTTVASGAASGAINLAVGANTINVVVTASDNVSTKTYTVTVTRAGNSNDNLTSLKMSKGIFSPTFASTTTSYNDAVGNTISSVTVTPTASDPDATIKVNGTAVTSGTASTAINMAVGANTINVVVTASDNVTAKTYTVTVNRASGGADGYNPGISVTKPTETPALAEDGIQVHQGVSPNGDGVNDFLQIDNISQYPNNKLSIMNRNGQLIYETSGYDNSSKVFDGHSNKNGQMQLPGTYFYQLDYTVDGVVKHKTGFLVLKY